MEYHRWLTALSYLHSAVLVCLMFMFQSPKIINIDIVHKLHFLMWPPPPLVILIKLLAQQFCAEQL